MTRFVMSLDEAENLVLFALEHGVGGDILVQKAPACTIETLARAVTELFSPNYEICVIGVHYGEKCYETLLTNEEYSNAIDLGNFFRVPCDKQDLNNENTHIHPDVRVLLASQIVIQIWWINTICRYNDYIKRHSSDNMP